LQLSDLSQRDVAPPLRAAVCARRYPRISPGEAPLELSHRAKGQPGSLFNRQPSPEDAVHNPRPPGLQNHYRADR